MCPLRPTPQRHLGPQVVALVPEVPAPRSPLWGRPHRERDKGVWLVHRPPPPAMGFLPCGNGSFMLGLCTRTLGL